MLLLLSNAAQNSMNGGDNSLVGGLVCVATLIALNYAIGYATFRSRKLEAIIEGRPQVLIHDGRLFEDVMARARLTHLELESALRRAGCASIGECRSAILENNGAISVVQRKGAPGG